MEESKMLKLMGSDGKVLFDWGRARQMYEEMKQIHKEVVENKIDPTIEFTKIRDVKSPKRANSHDAATDFFIPNYSKEFGFDLLEKNIDVPIAFYHDMDEEDPNKWMIGIPPHARILIPSGIKVNIRDKRTYLGAKNKGGIATNYGLVKTAEIIDADFQGEVFFGLENTTDNHVYVWTGMKIIQLLHQEYIDSNYVEITNDEYNRIGKTDRGEGERSSSGLD